VHRFTRPEQLCCWAGLTPRHRESDTTVHRGQITTQGNPLLHWAAVEAVQRIRRRPIGAARVHIGARRGASIGKGDSQEACSGRRPSCPRNSIWSK
jgi:transposase